MIIKVWVEKDGKQVEDLLEIHEEDIEGLPPKFRHGIINTMAGNFVHTMVKWGWEYLDEHKDGF